MDNDTIFNGGGQKYICNQHEAGNGGYVVC